MKIKESFEKWWNGLRLRTKRNLTFLLASSPTVVFILLPLFLIVTLPPSLFTALLVAPGLYPVFPLLVMLLWNNNKGYRKYQYALLEAWHQHIRSVGISIEEVHTAMSTHPYHWLHMGFQYDHADAEIVQKLCVEPLPRYGSFLEACGSRRLRDLEFLRWIRHEYPQKEGTTTNLVVLTEHAWGAIEDLMPRGWSPEDDLKTPVATPPIAA